MTSGKEAALAAQVIHREGELFKVFHAYMYFTSSHMRTTTLRIIGGSGPFELLFEKGYTRRSRELVLIHDTTTCSDPSLLLGRSVEPHLIVTVRGVIRST